MGIEDFRQIVGVVLGKGGGLNEPNKLPQGSATAPTGYSPSLFIKWRYHHLNLFYIHYQTFLPFPVFSVSEYPTAHESDILLGLFLEVSSRCPERGY